MKKDLEKELRNEIEHSVYNALPNRFEVGEGLKIAKEHGMNQRPYVRFVSETRGVFRTPHTRVREKQ
ncbi:hypothetical protein [Alistipes sp.]|uniref:hypothetical protein n=1 Tax=Alistipes sp. TaxID=1872444 RepID=UPI003AB61513